MQRIPPRDTFEEFMRCERQFIGKSGGQQIEAERQSDTMLWPNLVHATLQRALEIDEVERGIVRRWSQHAQVDTLSSEQFGLVRGRILASEKPQAGIAQQLDGSVEWGVARDLELDELIRPLVEALR